MLTPGQDSDKHKNIDQGCEVSGHMYIYKWMVNRLWSLGNNDMY